jgi:hypothetical protein
LQQKQNTPKVVVASLPVQSKVNDINISFNVLIEIAPRLIDKMRRNYPILFPPFGGFWGQMENLWWT